MPELLFEIGTEELPPNSISSLTTQIKENIINGLKENNIFVNNEVKTFNTPRRIAVYIEGLPIKQKEEDIEIKGPTKENAYDKNGNPTQAAIGFAKKYNLEPKDLIIKKINNIEYVFLKTKTGGEDTKKLLSKILPESIRKTTADKLMKWGNTDEKFVRPIRWLLAILDKEVIHFIYARVNSNKYTYGHRFLSSGEIELRSPVDYYKTLQDHKVIASSKERQEKILFLLKKEVQAINGSLAAFATLDSKLLNDVTNLTEYPNSLLCTFEEKFLSLPAHVIETVLERHQKYFVIYDNKDKEKLLSYFIVITNGTEIGNESIKENIKKGNEKVVRARLRDAQFFYEEDLKIPFTYESRGEKLSKITFQKGLGSMKEKVERIVKLSEYIYENLKGNSSLEVSRGDVITAARLCKLDLTTHMVFEFPELQGIIGSVYAEKNGYSSSIVKAISEHYKNAPQGLTGLIIGIVDKLDNIISLFSIGKIPTGSTDPFALRRQLHGVICSTYYLTKDFKLELNLSEVIKHYILKIAQEETRTKLTQDKENQVRDFLLERFKYLIHDIPITQDDDLIEAVFSTSDPLTNIKTTLDKITALKDSLSQSFLVAAKRLVRIVESNINGNLDSAILQTSYEKQLLNLFEELSKKEYKTYSEFLTELTILTEPINTFFDKVLVNDPDPKIKQTRHALLKKGKDLFERICDFNKIQERN